MVQTQFAMMKPSFLPVKSTFSPLAQAEKSLEVRVAHFTGHQGGGDGDLVNLVTNGNKKRGCWGYIIYLSNLI